MKNLVIISFLFLGSLAMAQDPGPYTGYTGISAINMQRDAKWPTNANGKTVIEVSWENPTAANAQGRAWVQEAIESTWETYSDIDFVGWGKSTSSSQGIRILVNDYAHPHAKGLGTQVDGVQNGLELSFEFLGQFKCYSYSKEECIKFIAVHEFGHAIGLAHEQNRPDCLCGEQPQGGGGGYYVTPCDLYSVMNYCNPKWSNEGELSTLDVRGIQQIYGKPNLSPDVVELTELRIVPSREQNRSSLRSIKQAIDYSTTFDIAMFTEEDTPVEQVSTAAVDNLPNTYTIRYFHPDDEDKAEDIKSYLSRNHGISGSSISVENMISRMGRTYPKYIGDMAKVIAFRSMLGLLLIMLLSAQTCTEQGNDYKLDEVNSISLEIPMFPSQFSTHYLMDKDVLYVHLINRISKTDSVINQATMDSGVYNQIMELITELDQSEYINSCVSDGQSYTVVLNQESKDQVKVRFENTYHKNLDKIIQTVNTRLDADLKIYFDKAALEALPTECD